MSFFGALDPVAKAVVAIGGAIVTTLTSALTDDQITSNEWMVIGVSFLTAILVYSKKNSTSQSSPPPPTPSPSNEEEATIEENFNYYDPDQTQEIRTLL